MTMNSPIIHEIKEQTKLIVLDYSLITRASLVILSEHLLLYKHTRNAWMTGSLASH